MVEKRKSMSKKVILIIVVMFIFTFGVVYMVSMDSAAKGDTATNSPNRTAKIETATTTGNNIDKIVLGSGYYIKKYKTDGFANKNPWNADVKIEKLPVYGNVFVNNTIENIADADIEVDEDGIVDVIFKKAVEVEGEEQKTDFSLDYFVNKYKESLGMKNAVQDITFTYLVSDEGKVERDNKYRIYERTGDIISQIVGYNFNYAIFYPMRGSNSLKNLNRVQYDLSGKLGDYPIISVDEAEQLLRAGQYDTISNAEFPGAEYIAGRELVYHIDIYNKTSMPFYQFYVELPADRFSLDEDTANLTVYGIYYVCAIQSEYLQNLPKCEIHFN